MSIDCLPGKAVAIDGSVQFPTKSGETLDMIGVLMGDEDSIETFGRSSDAGESFPDLAAAETGIDQQTGFLRLEIGAIAS